jgi:hypothetical protein
MSGRINEWEPILPRQVRSGTPRAHDCMICIMNGGDQVVRETDADLAMRT